MVSRMFSSSALKCALRGPVQHNIRSFASSSDQVVVMVNGAPGRMGISVSEAVVSRFGPEGLLNYSLTGNV